MKVLVTMLCAFLVLYAIVAMIGGMDGSGQGHTRVIFSAQRNAFCVGYTRPVLSLTSARC
jgi:hypothetical protein